MAYITLQQAKDFLGEIYENAYYSNTSEQIEDSFLTADIANIDAFIDASVQRAYNKTITGTQSLALLLDIAQKLLLYKAHSRMDYANIPVGVTDMNSEARMDLAKIAKGSILLPDETQAPKSNAFQAVYGSSTSTSEPVFKRANMRWF